ncbi:MAG: MobV family relaxase [Peptoniphilaceae bacterium]
MSMIVARMEKMKSGNLVGIGNHNQRKTKNHSNKDIDKTRSHLNYDLLNRTENYKTDIENFINENKSTQRAVRKDAVLVNEWIITSDQDFFKDLNTDEREKFFISSKNYFAEKFGDKNIRYAKVHLDETTPHMHLGIVPFDKENKLSAKRVFNRQALRDVQEELPNYLEELGFEIERGRKGSERKNLTIPEFKEMKEKQKELESENKLIEIEIKKNENQLLNYIQEMNVETSIDDVKFTRETKEVLVKGKEKLLGIPIPDKVKKPTGNIIISEKDYKKIIKFNSDIKEREPILRKLVKTDFYNENERLKDELEEQKNKNDKDIDDYNDLVGRYNKLNEENSLLKDQVSDLSNELRITYNSVRDNFKERLGGLKASRSAFKSLVDVISSKINNSLFKSEFDKENKKEIKRSSPTLRR